MDKLENERPRSKRRKKEDGKLKEPRAARLATSASQSRKGGKLRLPPSDRLEAPVDETPETAQESEQDRGNNPSRPVRRGRLRKGVRLHIAMRKVGVDERRVAERMADLVDGLRTRGGDAKVLLDTLKEAMRTLARATDASMPVHLRHNVPRPMRDPVRGRGEDERT